MRNRKSVTAVKYCVLSLVLLLIGFNIHNPIMFIWGRLNLGYQATTGQLQTKQQEAINAAVASASAQAKDQAKQELEAEIKNCPTCYMKYNPNTGTVDFTAK